MANLKSKCGKQELGHLLIKFFFEKKYHLAFYFSNFFFFRDSKTLLGNLRIRRINTVVLEITPYSVYSNFLSDSFLYQNKTVKTNQKLTMLKYKLKTIFSTFFNSFHMQAMDDGGDVFMKEQESPELRPMADILDAAIQSTGIGAQPGQQMGPPPPPPPPAYQWRNVCSSQQSWLGWPTFSSRFAALYHYQATS